MSAMPAIDASTLLVRNDELVAVEVDRTVVMMSVDQGMYFGLEGVGPRVWSLLATPRSVDDVCAALLAEYDVSPEQCRTEVQRFVSEMLEAGLVQPHHATAATARPDAGR